MAIETFPIVIVGCGPGSPEYLVPAGRAAIDDADVLVGSSRLLDAFSSSNAERISVGNDISLALAAMETHVGRKRVVVLVTGDPGLHSLAKPVIHRFGRSACRVIPGISSVQTAFARIGLDWEDASILSLHGHVPDIDPGFFLLRKKIAVLAGGEQSRSWLSALGSALAERHEVFVCSNLTLENEKVGSISPYDLGTIPLPSKTVILFIDKECLL